MREIQSFKSNHKLVTSSCEYTENDWCYIIGFSLRIFFFKYWKLNLILGFFHRNETNFHWMLKLFFGSFFGNSIIFGFATTKPIFQQFNNSRSLFSYNFLVCPWNPIYNIEQLCTKRHKRKPHKFTMKSFKCSFLFTEL